MIKRLLTALCIVSLLFSGSSSAWYKISQHHGFNAHPRLTEISLTNSDSGATGTVTTSAGVLPGDLLVVVQFSNAGGSPPANDLPADFTELVSLDIDTGDWSLLAIGAKIAEAGDESRTITVDLGDDEIALFEYRGNIGVSKFTMFSKNEEATAGDPSSQNATASGGDTPLCVIAAYGSNNNVTSDSFTPAEDTDLDTGPLVAKQKIYNSLPADVTVDMDDEGARNIMASFYLEIN